MFMESTVLSDVMLQITRPVCGHGVSGPVILSCYFTDYSTSVRTWCFWTCHSAMAWITWPSTLWGKLTRKSRWRRVSSRDTRPISRVTQMKRLFPIVVQNLHSLTLCIHWHSALIDTLHSLTLCIHWHSAFIDTAFIDTLHSLTLCIHWHSAFIDTLHSLTLCIHWHSDEQTTFFLDQISCIMKPV